MEEITKIIIAFATFFVSGVTGMMCYVHLLNTAAKSYDGKLYMFKHPLFMSVVTSMGCIMASSYFFIMVLYLKCRKRKRLHFSEQAMGHAERVTSGRTRVSGWMIFIASLFFYIGNLFYVFGDNMSTTGSSLATESLIVVIIPLMVKFYLKSKFHNYCWGGAIMMCIGIILYGIGQMYGIERFLANLKTEQIPKQEKNTALGVFLTFIGIIFIAASRVLIEKHVKRDDIVPTIANLWFGFFGTVVAGVVLLPAHYMIIPLFSASPQNRFEDLRSVITQLCNNRALIWRLVLYAISYGAATNVYITFTKDDSATAAQVLYFLVLILAQIMNLLTEKGRAMFHWLMGMGLGFAVVGTLLYFDIIIMPIILWIVPKCCGRQEDPEKMDDQERARDELSATDTSRSGKQNMTLQLRDISLAL